MGIRSLLLTLALLPAVLAVAAVPAAATPATDSQFGRAKLNWRDCDDGFQCAKLRVPRDWDRPRGRRIALSLIRLPATKGRVVGSLLINYGGPGASGVSSLRQSGKQIRRATHGRMHVVSWDPRGVGQSAPILCPEGNDAYFNADPATEAGLATMADAVRQRADACFARYGGYLADIGTDQTVKDLDALRREVGDRKANFLRLSYGTRVGSVYAAHYPRRIRTMVLDGSLPPVSTITGVSIGLATAFEDALNQYFKRCAQGPPCALGDDPAAGYDALAASIRSNPPEVPGTGGRRLTIGLFNQATLALIINYQGSSGAAAQAIAQYRTTGDPTALYQLGSAIAGGRQPDGSYANNGTETFQFINCLDWQDRPTLAQVAAAIDSVKQVAPRLGAFAVTYPMMNSTACPVPAKPVPPPTSNAIPPVLVVGNDHDAETPLNSGQQLSQALRGSRLLVWQGLGHTAFTTSPCVARTAGNYLVTRRLPPAGTFCPDLPIG
ncbi:MAG TPA: alpha/beta fold hydrolase [Thermoleophilaceae bacterium]